MPIDQLYSLVLQNKYLQSLLILVFFFILSKIVVYIFEKVFVKLTKKTKTKIDDLIIKRSNKPISLILLLIGIKLALIPLGLSDAVNIALNRTISTLIVILVAYLVIVILDIFIDGWGKSFAERTKSKLDDQLLSLFHKFSKIMIVILTLLFVLDVWGIKVVSLLASLGIAGIAIAFALQSTLGNIFGGISLIIDKSFKVGDIIKLDTGEMGIVKDIGLRSTKIRTWDNEILVVPNGKLAEARIQNFSQPDPTSRINIDVATAYGSNPEKVKKLIIDTINKIPHVLKEPKPRVLFLEMGDSALKFKAQFYVDNLANKWPTHQEVITKIYNNLNKAKITIPFPQRDVWIKEMKKRS